MSSGDDIEAGRVTGGNSTTILVGERPDDEDAPDFNGDFVLIVGPTGEKLRQSRHATGGILGLGNGSIPKIPSGVGVTGFGGANQGTGILGVGGAPGNSVGGGGIGVHGQGGRGITFFSGDTVPAGPGVLGMGGIGITPEGGNNPQFSHRNEVTPGAPGVMGIAGGIADGEVGISYAANKSGVFGFNGQTTEPAFGVFGRCDSPVGAGVGAFSQEGIGLAGYSVDGVAVYGRSVNRHAVFGDARGVPGGPAYGVYGVTGHTWGVVGQIDPHTISLDAIAVVGIANIEIGPDSHISYVGQAGYFMGSVGVNGDFTVYGAKNAAVPHHDGSHRLLYSIESPESWFEDFGEGTLALGRVHIELDPDFAALIHTHNYQVFITPYGDCSGLYVTGRCQTGFDVIEAGNGKSDTPFGYRVVAKRKDIPGERLAKVKAPLTAHDRPVEPPKVSMTSEQLDHLSKEASFTPPSVQSACNQGLDMK